MARLQHPSNRFRQAPSNKQHHHRPPHLHLLLPTSLPSMVNILSDDTRNDQCISPNKPRSSRRATAIVLALLALHHVGFKIMYLPLNRLIENRFCRSYYDEHDPSLIPGDGIVPESLCKVNAVQQQLAALFGTIESLHLFIGSSCYFQDPSSYATDASQISR